MRISHEELVELVRTGFNVRDLAPPPGTNEREFQALLLAVARGLGWRVVHYMPARTAAGWRTATQGDIGFPDCVLVRRGRLVIWELKTERGTLRQGQHEWLMALAGVSDRSGGAVVAGIVRPSDWAYIVDVLTRE